MSDLLSMVETIQRWKEYAKSEVESIGDWRDVDLDQLRRAYDLRSFAALDRFQAVFNRDSHPDYNMWYVRTTMILDELARRYPKFDSAPIQTVYSAICAWHRDRHARNIPPQHDLLDRNEPPFQLGALDRALAAMNRLQDELQAEHRAAGAQYLRNRQPNTPRVKVGQVGPKDGGDACGDERYLCDSARRVLEELRKRDGRNATALAECLKGQTPELVRRAVTDIRAVYGEDAVRTEGRGPKSRYVLSESLRSAT